MNFDSSLFMGSTCTQLLFHVVFSTKDRQPLITPVLQGELYKYIGGIIRGEGGSFIEFLRKQKIEYREEYLWA